jgi:DNA-binding transcriptional LysR family regulator
VELLQLRYFQTVARLEHMTKAAEALRVAQPALSKTIARLETELGVPLFDRNRRQIRLNAYGRAFLAKVDAALSALEEGRREVADLAGTERGSLALATTTLGRLTPALIAFRARYPEVRFRIVQLAPSATGELARMLENGDADLAFTAASLERVGIREQPVLNAEVRLAVPPGHRLQGRRAIRLSEVAAEPFIEYREGHPFRAANESFRRKAGIRPPIVCEVDEPEALAHLVRAGLGVAFVPVCREEGDAGLTLLRIEEPECRRIFVAVSSERRYLSRAARAFQQFLVQFYEGQPAAAGR